MTKFVIKGSGDEARALLKATLDAQHAAFDAGLEAMFKSAPSKSAPLKPAPRPQPQPQSRAPAEPASRPRGSTGSSLGSTRSKRFS